MEFFFFFLISKRRNGISKRISNETCQRNKMIGKQSLTHLTCWGNYKTFKPNDVRKHLKEKIFVGQKRYTINIPEPAFRKPAKPILATHQYFLKTIDKPDIAGNKSQTEIHRPERHTINLNLHSGNQLNLQENKEIHVFVDIERMMGMTLRHHNLKKSLNH